uniref:GYF domain-containing protein n=1 Tax=Panagrolaimus sp. ES5 TaxID=591445 RepID=A0AC34F7B9_9BILA
MKSYKNLSTTFLNPNRNSEKNDEFKKAKSSNSSTLSLHIEAYENSIEATNNSDAVERVNLKAKDKGLGLVKRKFINGSTSNTQNPFEFPRQQDDQVSHPELMQFAASQQLLNPNQMEVSEWKAKVPKYPHNIYNCNGLNDIWRYFYSCCTLEFVKNSFKESLRNVRILFESLENSTPTQNSLVLNKHPKSIAAASERFIIEQKQIVAKAKNNKKKVPALTMFNPNIINNLVLLYDIKFMEAVEDLMRMRGLHAVLGGVYLTAAFQNTKTSVEEIVKAKIVQERENIQFECGEFGVEYLEHYLHWTKGKRHHYQSQSHANSYAEALLSIAGKIEVNTAKIEVNTAKTENHISKLLNIPRFKPGQRMPHNGHDEPKTSEGYDAPTAKQKNWYICESGKNYGPFESVQMGSWYTSNFFNTHLKFSNDLDNPFSTLAELIHKNGIEAPFIFQKAQPRAIMSQAENAAMENGVVKTYSSLLQAPAATVAQAPWTAPHVLQSKRSILEIQLEEEKGRKEQDEIQRKQNTTKPSSPWSGTKITSTFVSKSTVGGSNDSNQSPANPRAATSTPVINNSAWPAMPAPATPPPKKETPKQQPKQNAQKEQSDPNEFQKWAIKAIKDLNISVGTTVDAEMFTGFVESVIDPLDIKEYFVSYFGESDTVKEFVKCFLENRIASNPRKKLITDDLSSNYASSPIVVAKKTSSAFKAHEAYEKEQPRQRNASTKIRFIYAPHRKEAREINRILYSPSSSVVTHKGILAKEKCSYKDILDALSSMNIRREAKHYDVFLAFATSHLFCDYVIEFLITGLIDLSYYLTIATEDDDLEMLQQFADMILKQLLNNKIINK